jgi:hypothetical protein
VRLDTLGYVYSPRRPGRCAGTPTDAKKDATHLFITIEGADGSALVIECPAKKEGRARQLAALVHAKYGPPAAAATPTPEDTQPEG